MSVDVDRLGGGEDLTLPFFSLATSLISFNCGVVVLHFGGHDTVYDATLVKRRAWVLCITLGFV